MLKDSLEEILLRELSRLETEIRSFPENKLNSIAGEIKNSAGNLCLHLCGNLQHFIGAVIGNTGYVRNRDFEFSAKEITAGQLLLELDNTRKAISSGFSKITDETLQHIYPQDILGKEVSTSYFLVHLISHLDYHLGQINYLRRLIP